jgi:hypothetical protein
MRFSIIVATMTRSSESASAGSTGAPQTFRVAWRAVRAVREFAAAETGGTIAAPAERSWEARGIVAATIVAQTTIRPNGSGRDGTTPRSATVERESLIAR